MPHHDRPVLLLLPALVTDARLWRHTIDALSDRVRPHVADLRAADSMEELAQQVLDELDEERFILAGLSLGGYVAFEIMRRAPQRVLGLAVLDSSARPDTPEATHTRLQQIEMAGSDYPALVEQLLPRMVSPASINEPAIGGCFRQMALAAGAEVFVRQQKAIMGRVDSRPLLPTVSCPSLVLCGADDQVTPPALHDEMAAALPAARRVTIARCAHLSALDQPHQVSSALRHWLMEQRLLQS